MGAPSIEEYDLVYAIIMWAPLVEYVAEIGW